MSGKLYAAKYMQDFQCLGGDCEDTCCQKWDIRLDRQHYTILRERLEQNEQEKQQFEQFLIRQPADLASDSNFAYIKLDDNGFCTFLAGDGLCHLHAKYGVEPLSDVCAFFPRVFSSLDGRVELTGALSCPEVVRRCLLGDDAKFELVSISASDLIRPDYPLARQCQPEADEYQRHFTRTREVMLQLANDEDFAFETRLYFLANLSYRLSAHYHVDCQDAQKLVDKELQRIQDDSVRQQLDDYFFKYSSNEPLAMIVIQAILQIRIQHDAHDPLSILASDLLATYRQAQHPPADPDVYGDNIAPDKLAAAFAANWDALNARFGAQLEMYLTRYLSNCLQREWFISLPDPFIYIHLLCIRIAVLRFLIASHPRVIELVHSESELQDTEATFSHEVVALVYQFARSIDHNHAFLHIILQAIHEQQMMSFEFSMPFIKF